MSERNPCDSRLLSILQEMGYLDEDSKTQVLREKQLHPRSGLVGEILLAKGLATQRQIDAALAKQRERRKRASLVEDQYIDSLGELIQMAGTVAGVSVGVYAGLLIVPIPKDMAIRSAVFFGFGLSSSLSILGSILLLSDLVKKLRRDPIKEFFAPPLGLLYWAIVSLGLFFLLLAYGHWQGS